MLGRESRGRWRCRNRDSEGRKKTDRRRFTAGNACGAQFPKLLGDAAAVKDDGKPSRRTKHAGTQRQKEPLSMYLKTSGRNRKGTLC